MRRKSVFLLLLLAIGVILFLTCSVSVTKQSRSESTTTIEKNGKKYQLVTWSERGFIFGKQGWSRSVDSGQGWKLVEEGTGECPYGDIFGRGWAE